MATSPYASEWIDDLRVLQDHAPETLAVQARELRVERVHEIWHTTRVSILTVAVTVVVAACALVAVVR